MPNPHTLRASRVESVVRAAFRRNLLVLAVEQCALALALVFAGAIAMLLVGTQILNWYWLLLLLGAGLAIGGYRLRQRLWTEYQVAQAIDRRLGLHDSISTAWFLLRRAGPGNDPAMGFQLAHAEEAARRVESAGVFPFRWQRPWAITGGLIAVAFGLFAVRYLVHDSLSLRESLITLHIAPVLERVEKALSAEDPNQVAKAGPDGTDLAGDPKTARSQTNEEENDVLGVKSQKADQPGDTDSTYQSPAKKPGINDDGSPDSGKPANSSRQTPGQQTAGEQAQNNSDSTPGGDRNPQAATNTKEQNARGQQQSPNLMGKMKDAISSFLAKMQSPSNGQKSAQEGEKPVADQKNSEQTGASKDQQAASQDSRNQKGSEEQNAQGDQQSQTTEKAQASQGRSSDRASDRNGSDAHSGIGRQDGQKDLKAAEQQEAMGKLAEIIGKRSANLTGEVMVETPSGKQQLRTQYSQKVGKHADLGGEINRDEVPLMYQQYVKEYMEQVRKQAKSN